MRHPGEKRKRVYSREEERVLVRKRGRLPPVEDSFLADLPPSDEEEYFYEETQDISY